MTKTKNSVTKELLLFSFLLFVSAYIAVDVYNYHINQAEKVILFEMIMTMNNNTILQNQVNINTEQQIQMITQILYQMNGGQ